MSSQIQISDIDSKKVVELKEIAKELKISKWYNMTKVQLVKSIKSVLNKKCCSLKIHNSQLVKCENTCNDKYCKEHEHKYRLEKPDDCPVCMEHILETEETPLECGHWIHKGCLVKSVKHTCPLCREKMKDFEIEYIFGIQNQVQSQNPNQNQNSVNFRFDIDIFYRIILNIGSSGLEHSGYVMSDNDYTGIERSENDQFNDFIYSIIQNLLNEHNINLSDELIMMIGAQLYNDIRMARLIEISYNASRLIGLETFLNRLFVFVKDIIYDRISEIYNEYIQRN